MSKLDGFSCSVNGRTHKRFDTVEEASWSQSHLQQQQLAEATTLTTTTTDRDTCSQSERQRQNQRGEERSQSRPASLAATYWLGGYHASNR